MIFYLLLLVFLIRVESKPFQVANASQVLPIVVWHGMGDTGFDGQFKSWLSLQVYPGVYVKSITTGATADEDRKSSFFGNVNDQVDRVCRELKDDPELSGGFNAIGLSQGGQFLRAYVERCNNPPLRNLLTLGSQHQGVADVPRCQDSSNWQCRLMRSVVKKGVYTSYVQSNVVQGQYFKDPRQYQKYLEKSGFLADINNERAVKNETYRQNLLQLERLIMVKFEQDTMVSPVESQWFGFYDTANHKDPMSVVLSMRDTELYKQDWLGLQQLDSQDKLKFHSVPGDHLRISLKYLKNDILFKYFNNTVVDTPPDEPYENDFMSSLLLHDSNSDSKALNLQMN